MDTKLTLKLDQEVINKAKKYAASQKRSLSRLIETYLKTLIENENVLSNENIEISPFVKSMKTGVKLPANLDHKKVYGEYLEEKYQ